MKLGIFGSGSLGKEIYDIIVDNNDNSWESIFFVDDITKEKKYEGLDIYSYEEIKNKFDKNSISFVIAVGEPYYRNVILSTIKKDGYTIETIISRHAYLSHNCILERGCIIFPFVYLAVHTVIHQNAIIHANARIEDYCEIGNNTFVSSGAFIGADTIIGENAFVGPNSSLKDHLKIGNKTVIGMGTVVLHDVNDGSVIVGNPGKSIKTNTNNKIFSHSVVK